LDAVSTIPGKRFNVQGLKFKVARFRKLKRQELRIIGAEKQNVWIGDFKL
jgi:hypothetical protein